MDKTKIIFIISIFCVIVLTVLALAGQNSFSVTKKIAGAQDEKLTNLKIAILPHRANDSNPQILAKSVYLIDVDSFLPMYAKNETERLPIASTTKIATAIVVLENYRDRLNDVVTITPAMINVEETTIKLRAGEKITVENLLNGLLINSGNDAAFALSQYFGGTKSFVAQMNNKVAQIGLTDTQYFDPAGLNDEGHSTARDLAILGAYALRNPKFAEIVRGSDKIITSIDGRVQHDLKMSNRLLQPDDASYFPSAIGIKTGFTYAAGHVLVSAATQNNHTILAVVLNTNEETIYASAKESKKLLEWGFANWTW